MHFRCSFLFIRCAWVYKMWPYFYYYYVLFIYLFIKNNKIHRLILQNTTNDTFPINRGLLFQYNNRPSPPTQLYLYPIQFAKNKVSLLVEAYNCFYREKHEINLIFFCYIIIYNNLHHNIIYISYNSNNNKLTPSTSYQRYFYIMIHHHGDVYKWSGKLTIVQSLCRRARAYKR